MPRPPLVALLLTFLSVGVVNAAEPSWTDRDDWGTYFADAGVTGTIVIVDERSQAHLVFNRARAGERFIPASTFKVPHALFALDSGAVRDEFQVFKWDHTERDIAEWNGDQTLRSSMRRSVVWVYQDFARKIGERRERQYLQRIGYGNADPSGGIDRFWLEGALRISAFEEVAFLRRLYRNALPFRVADQRLVKDVMIVGAGKDWILRAKTGWGRRLTPEVGWWVGWVEHPTGAVFFALNIEMAHDGDDLPKREGIARAILQSIDALPK